MVTGVGLLTDGLDASPRCMCSQRCPVSLGHDWSDDDGLDPVLSMSVISAMRRRPYAMAGMHTFVTLGLQRVMRRCQRSVSRWMSYGQHVCLCCRCPCVVCCMCARDAWCVPRSAGCYVADAVGCLLILMLLPLTASQQGHCDAVAAAVAQVHSPLDAATWPAGHN